MKFLAIDTSGTRLTLVAVNGDTVVKERGEACAQMHSVKLMGEIERVLALAHLTAQECDFFACTVGPGSFTGIRIGIATVKGLCLACEKKAVAVTSLDAIAYAETGNRVALIDALHGNYYACAYGAETEPPEFMTGEQVNAYLARGFAPLSAAELEIPSKCTDTAEGLYRAVLAKQNERADARDLTALYLRKSSAEEQR